ncbi:hypothetical protein D4764_04G0003230 [Takifugu flavidus]|uniref:Uncharacterized protein n=1 Tax=Takifugu flavidus TaxID=433684 RepID=A0A5C6N354_9TELE|nr:hypothetical protein D4764_04G0003230 [Takifugu flavidus]
MEYFDLKRLVRPSHPLPHSLPRPYARPCCGTCRGGRHGPEEEVTRLRSSAEDRTGIHSCQAVDSLRAAARPRALDAQRCVRKDGIVLAHSS